MVQRMLFAREAHKLTIDVRVSCNSLSNRVRFVSLVKKRGERVQPVGLR